jgi:hypothetical protein
VITRRTLIKGGVLAAAGTAAAVIPSNLGGMPRTNRPVPKIVVSIDPQFAKDLPKPRELVRVLQKYADLLLPVWGVTAEIVAGSPEPHPESWNLHFGEDEQELYGAYAYHAWDSTFLPQPFAIVEVPISLDALGEVTSAATHELAEMLVNPGTNYWADVSPADVKTATQFDLLAMEVCDPVQAVAFKLDGHAVSDFVYPAFFEPWRDGRIDYCGALSEARAIAPGGYQIVRTNKGIRDDVNEPPERRCLRHRIISRRLCTSGLPSTG